MPELTVVCLRDRGRVGGLSGGGGGRATGRADRADRGPQMGGDCLNYGCVPSKALLAAAKALGPGDWAGAQARVRAAIAAIEPHDSQARFEGLGVTVLRAGAASPGSARCRLMTPGSPPAGS